MHPPSDLDRRIEGALREWAQALERDAGGGWRLAAVNGALTRLRARMVGEDWLVVSTRYDSAGESWWPLLELNASLGGSARLARAADGDLEMRADVYLGADTDGHDRAARGGTSIETRVAAMCDDVVSARHGGIHSPADRMEPGSGPCQTDRLVTLCRDAGWTATPCASGEVQVPLDTGVASYHATLSLDRSARLDAVVPFTTAPVPSGAGRDAIAVALLEAAAHLRTVKGCVIPQAGAEVAGIAVAAERWPADPASVDRALAALSVACRTIGREVQALRDAPLARAYLAIRFRNHHTEDTPCLQLPS
jgi:hypothetical protein